MWDDDDYDPTAQLNERLADAVATVGLSDDVATPSESEKPEPEPEKKTTSKAKSSAKSATSNNKDYQDRQLTQAEILDLQQRGDMEMFAGVLGMELKKEDRVLNTPQVAEPVVEKDLDALEKELKEKERVEQLEKAKKNQPKKKAPKEEVYEDYVEDEYDDYTDKYY